jgi:hypothetical protein
MKLRELRKLIREEIQKSILPIDTIIVAYTFYRGNTSDIYSVDLEKDQERVKKFSGRGGLDEAIDWLVEKGIIPEGTNKNTLEKEATKKGIRYIETDFDVS